MVVKVNVEPVNQPATDFGGVDKKKKKNKIK